MSKRTSLLYASVVLLVLTMVQPAVAQGDLSLAGSWVGVYETGEQVNLFFVEWDEAGNGRLHTRQALRPMQIDDFQQEGQRIQFVVDNEDNTLSFSGDWLDGALAGQVTNGQEDGRFYLAPLVEMTTGAFDAYVGSYHAGAGPAILVTRGDRVEQLFYQAGDQQVRLYPIGEQRFLSALGEQLTFDQARLQRSSALYPERSAVETSTLTEEYREVPVTFQNSGVTLSGNLLLPAGEGPFPALILLHGSGAGERHFYRVFGDQFARQGIAALIYDKRGHGESTGRQDDITLHTLVDDARSGIHFLAQHDMVDAAQIGVWGFSEGGRVVPMVAAQNDDIAYAIAVSAPAMGAGALDMWRQDKLGLEDGKPDQVRSLILKMSQLRQSLATWQAADDGWVLDPAPFWGQMTQPTLLLYGSEDRLVPADDSASIIVSALKEAGNETFALVVFPAANHDVMLVDTAVATFAPGYFETITAWLQDKHVASQSSYPLRASGEFAENGRYAPVAWYGQFWLHLALFLFMGVMLLWAVVSFLVRYLRGQDTSLARFSFIAGICGLLLLTIFGWNMVVFWQTGEVSGAAWLMQLLSVVTAASVLVYLAKLLFVWLSTRQLGKQHIPFAVASVVLLLFILYWSTP